MTGCKIGKITMKNGGAPVYLFSSRQEKYTDETAMLSSGLNRAKNGEFVAIGIIAIRSDGFLETAFSEGMSHDIFTGMVGCDLLKRRLMDTLK